MAAVEAVPSREHMKALAGGHNVDRVHRVRMRYSSPVSRKPCVYIIGNKRYAHLPRSLSTCADQPDHLQAAPSAFRPPTHPHRLTTHTRQREAKEWEEEEEQRRGGALSRRAEDARLSGSMCCSRCRRWLVHLRLRTR